MTLYDECVIKAETIWMTARGDDDVALYELVVRAVLETVRDHSLSPRTVDEMVRVLAEVGITGEARALPTDLPAGDAHAHDLDIVHCRI